MSRDAIIESIDELNLPTARSRVAALANVENLFDRYYASQDPFSDCDILPHVVAASSR